MLKLTHTYEINSIRVWYHCLPFIFFIRFGPVSVNNLKP
jgi:hypothetical protein